MKALSITQPEVTREKLLALAKQVTGVWIGLKIAAVLLVLEGQHPGWISALFGLSRTTLVNRIQGLNQNGTTSLIRNPRLGRSTQLTSAVKKQLKQNLEKTPQEFDLARAGWDGPTLVVHLKENETVVFQDETGFSLHPRLGRGWAKKGKRLKVPTTSQHRKRLNLSGWVAPLLGEKGLIRTAKGNHEGFIQVLRHMLKRLRGYIISLCRWS